MQIVYDMKFYLLIHNLLLGNTGNQSSKLRLVYNVLYLNFGSLILVAPKVDIVCV